MERELKKLGEMLCRVLEIEDCDKHISMETVLIPAKNSEHDIGMSSVDYIEFLLDVEREFEIVYNFDVVFETIGDLVEYIRNYKEEC